MHPLLRCVCLCGALAGPGAAVFAQEVTPTLPPGGSAPAAASGAAGKASATDGVARAFNVNNLESGTLLQIINKAFDTSSDSIDPEKGTFSWKGHTYDLGQMRVFRGRFERFLALPVTRDDDLYRATLEEIGNLLSTRNAEGAQVNVVKAWTLLYRASEFDADGNNSLGVANQVFNAWRIRDEKEAFNVTRNELERIRRQQQGGVVYGGDTLAAQTGRGVADAVSGSAILGNLTTGTAGDSAATTTTTSGNATTTTTGNQSGNRNNRTNGNASGGNQGGTPGGVSSAGSQTVGPVGQLFRARELAETEAKLKSLEAAGLLSVTQAKLQFQSQLVSLFIQRRFQHCLIAASFYRYIFKGSHQNLEVGKKELASFLPSTDLAFTVEMVESLARDAINDVNNGMAAVRASYDDGRKVAALERLQETFFLGEYLPAVSQFERERKQQLYTLYRKIDEARKLADLRDFDGVIQITGEIGALTQDFRTAEVSAAVRSAQRMSTLSLNAAQQAAAKGDYAKAQEYVEKSAQLWPLNPAIKNYTENMASQADLGTQASTLFDDAFKRDDYRRIYERRAELAVAFLNDGVRGPQLKAVIDRMARVEIYLAQAQELLAQNNAFSAWEALVGATPLAPNDVELNQRKAQLAPRVAEFIGRLDQARRYEDERRFASSLTSYLSAQDVHPGSQLARLGLDRVTLAILDQLATEQAEKPAVEAK